jgi:hypothetical protein
MATRDGRAAGRRVRVKGAVLERGSATARLFAGEGARLAFADLTTEWRADGGGR